MSNFYVILLSDSSGYYYPTNTITNITTKLTTQLEFEPDEWDVGLQYRILMATINVSDKTNRLDSQIIFPVKEHKSDFITNIHLLEPSKQETFLRIFNENLNKYREPSKRLFNSCYGENQSE
jgi:hypothetical protein